MLLLRRMRRGDGKARRGAHRRPAHAAASATLRSNRRLELRVMLRVIVMLLARMREPMTLCWYQAWFNIYSMLTALALLAFTMVELCPLSAACKRCR